MSYTYPTHIKELLDLDQLQRDINAGYIKRSYHPTLPLTLLCYSHLAQFDQYWTNETIVCRGLIYDEEGWVIARGPSKFFNHNQPQVEGKFKLTDQCIVSDKMDGSLGIYWRYGGEEGIATKGSFTSPQAIKATELYKNSELKEYYDQCWDQSMFNGDTPIFEIIYPEGRIVLDYGDKEYLEHLGNVSILDGTITRPIISDIMIAGRGRPMLTVAEALALPPRDNAEGLVLDVFSETGLLHVKYKQEDYKRLHAIITGTSSRNIWVYLVAEKFKDHPYIVEKDKRWGSVFLYDVEAFVSAAEKPNWREILFDTVPDEFEDWVHETIAELETEAEKLTWDALTFAQVISHLKGKELHDEAKAHPFAMEICRYLRHGDLSQIEMRAWREIQPRGVSLPPFAARDDA